MKWLIVFVIVLSLLFSISSVVYGSNGVPYANFDCDIIGEIEPHDIQMLAHQVYGQQLIGKSVMESLYWLVESRFAVCPEFDVRQYFGSYQLKDYEHLDPWMIFKKDMDKLDLIWDGQIYNPEHSNWTCNNLSDVVGFTQAREALAKIANVNPPNNRQALLIQLTAVCNIERPLLFHGLKLKKKGTFPYDVLPPIAAPIKIQESKPVELMPVDNSFQFKLPSLQTQILTATSFVLLLILCYLLYRHQKNFIPTKKKQTKTVSIDDLVL